MLKNLFNELRQKPRLRWGVVLIIATLWLYGVLWLRDEVQQATQQHRSTTMSVARLRTQLTQTEWPERVAPAKTLAVQLEGRLWQAATAGLAQAAFQDALNAAMTKAGVARAQISVAVVDDAPPANTASPNNTLGSDPAGTVAPPDLWHIKAKVGFDFAAPSLLALLAQLETSPKQIVVTALGVNKDLPNHVDMELYGYFQKPLAPATPPAPAQAAL